jgi:hypothetical protein
MPGTQTTVRVNLQTEQGRRHQRRIEQAQQQALERLRKASQSPAPAADSKPPTR